MLPPPLYLRSTHLKNTNIIRPTNIMPGHPRTEQKKDGKRLSSMQSQGKGGGGGVVGRGGGAENAGGAGDEVGVCLHIQTHTTAALICMSAATDTQRQT